MCRARRCATEVGAGGESVHDTPYGGGASYRAPAAAPRCHAIIDLPVRPELTRMRGWSIDFRIMVLHTIRSRCDRSARDLRHALIEYRKRSGDVPYAVEADLLLYGNLLRHYLQWSTGILPAMREAVAKHPIATGPVNLLIDRVVAYFADESRWPQIAGLEHPARLLIPAYYTVRAAQHVNAAFNPHLLTLDLIEAHEFAIELLGKSTSDVICAHKNADMNSVGRVEQDSVPRKSVHYRSFLHSGNRDSLKAARAAKPKPPDPSATANAPGDMRRTWRRVAPVPAAAVTEDQRTRWDQELAGTSIVLGRWNSPPDYSGSSHTSTESVLYLLANHHFRKTVAGTMRVGYAGIMQKTPIHRETVGTWEVRSTGTRIYLVLLDTSGDMESLWLEKGAGGILRVDGQDRTWRSR